MSNRRIGMIEYLITRAINGVCFRAVKRAAKFSTPEIREFALEFLDHPDFTALRRTNNELGFVSLLPEINPEIRQELLAVVWKVMDERRRRLAIDDRLAALKAERDVILRRAQALKFRYVDSPN